LNLSSTTTSTTRGKTLDSLHEVEHPQQMCIFAARIILTRHGIFFQSI
jgi:hypothetical protein